MYYVGIDNGITGSIGIVNQDSSDEHFFQTPTISTLNYQKSKEKHISRVNVRQMKALIHNVIGDQPAKVLLERPFINPGMGTKLMAIKCTCPECAHKYVMEKAFAQPFPKFFQASVSAARALESTLIVLESLSLGFDYVDSKAWQKEFLPKGIKGSPALKKASLELAIRKWPQFTELLNKQKDGDGLFIAEYCKVYYMQDQPVAEVDPFDV
jgi:hypothetical protein